MGFVWVPDGNLLLALAGLNPHPYSNRIQRFRRMDFVNLDGIDNPNKVSLIYAFSNRKKRVTCGFDLRRVQSSFLDRLQVLKA